MLSPLLQAIREGDRAAFDAALQPERTWLVDRATHLIDDSLRRFVDPEDLVQDVLLTAYRKLATTRVQERSSLRSWLAQVLTRRVLDERRRHLRQRRMNLGTRSLDDAEGRSSTGSTQCLGQCVPGNVPSPSFAAATGEDSSRIQQVLSRLSPDHRRVIQLLRLEGLSTAEVAGCMQRSQKAVYKLFARALNEFRVILAGLPVETESSGEEDSGR